MTTNEEPVAPPSSSVVRVDDRPVRWRMFAILAALLPTGWLLQRGAGWVPELTERVYSRRIYPLVERVLCAIASCSPIAIGETLLLVAAAFVAVRVARGLLACRRRRRSRRNLLAHALTESVAAFGFLFLMFQLMWGINHSRLPFATQIGLRPGAVDASRLARVAQLLADRAAAVRPKDFDGSQPFLAADWREAVGDAYAAAGGQVPVLAGPRPMIRGAWISPLMTLASISGIYSPFTGEPNVNVEIPEVMRPFIACHEIAHLRGYAREDEADFIAWWVGSRSSDAHIAYSCELLAFRIAMNALYLADNAAWANLHAKGPRDVLRDNAAIDAFWWGRPKLVSEVITKITITTNDLYLKSSGHPEGVLSYGRMVDLLIACLID